MADNSAAIAQIRAILTAGVSRVVIDGQVVEYDLPQLRRQLAELLQTDTGSNAAANNAARPRAATIYLGGF